MIVGRDWRWAGSPAPTPHAPIPVYGIILTALICLWFVAAVILFFRSRLAWLGSLAGVGLAVGFFVWVLCCIFGECFFPNAQATHDRENLLSGTVWFVYVMGFCFYGVCIALSVVLFIGLFKMRRDLRQI
jgi:hypothetical protein